MQAAEQITVPPQTRTKLFRPGSSVDQTAVEAEATGWGWLPALSLVTAVSLLLMAFAYSASLEGEVWMWDSSLYWIRFLVLFVPIAVRLISPRATRKERIGLIIVLGSGLYLVKVLYSPLEFKFSDELQHWRSTYDILQNGRLFQNNPILPASPSYPGLQNATTALISLSGLTIFEAGIIVIGVGRLVFVLALYFFYEQISRSAHVAGIATMLNMTNPHFMFFNSFFIYQALALPLMALVLFAAARGEYTHDGNRTGLKLVLLLGLVAVTVTHHVTSYGLLVFLLLWTVVALYIRRSKQEQSVPVWTALLALVVILTWITYVSLITVDYLGPQLSRGVSELIGLVTREETAGRTFHAPDRPLPELIVGLSSIGLIMSGLPLGMWQIWRRYRDNSLALLMAVGSLGYPGSLVMRLTSQGSEFTGRTWTFLFMVIAFVLAVWVVEVWKSRQQLWMIRVFFPALSAFLFLAGMINGYPPPWCRLPGPYQVAASQRSVEAQGVAAAEWARVTLGPGNRMATDFTNHHLMGSYGLQDSTRYLPEVFFALQLRSFQQDAIRRREIRYLVVDNRLSSALPLYGTYFNSWEPNAYHHTNPVDPVALAKFDDVINVSRIFDSGDIVIYDVGALSRVP